MIKVGGAGAFAAGLAGCLGGGNGDGGQGTTTDGGDGTTEGGDAGTTEGGKTTQSGDSLDVGMVYATGGLGDNSFNDMAHKGIKQAKSEFGLSFRNTEPGNPTEVGTLQRKLAQSSNPNYDLICCIGFVQADPLARNAQRFSDQKFTIVDESVDQPNVASYRFKEHQGSFQVGHLAGLLTDMDFSAGKGKTNGDLTVGFVGGKETPLIQKFEAGYKAGVKHANSDIKVLSAYAGAWNDPAQGQSITNSMISNGADIVYHAAGGTGTGVFKAAQSKGRFAIGVDADQSKTLPKYSNVILASMVKRVDEAVYRSAQNVQNGSFKGGTTQTLGLKEKGVAAVYGQQLGSKIPEDVKSKLQKSRKKVVAGDISVPKKPGKV
ncbi:BMP family protein [Halorussus vallis]|nr:BMP family protein [Halorussus vallis]USZ75571.1 BMP family protein [Halorussus vallis]